VQMTANVGMVVSIWRITDIHSENFRVSERTSESNSPSSQSPSSEFTSLYGAVNQREPSAELRVSLKQKSNVEFNLTPPLGSGPYPTLQEREVEMGKGYPLDHFSDGGQESDDETLVDSEENGEPGEGINKIETARSHSRELSPKSRLSSTRSVRSATSKTSKTSSHPSSIHQVCKMVF
jgi:hypothetical protein